MSGAPHDEVRRATADDAETISALNAEVQQAHATALPHLFKPASPEAFPTVLVRQLIASPGSYLFIAHIDGAAVGYLYAQRIEGRESPSREAWDRLYVHHLSVNSASQRQGAGQALMQAVKRLALEQGISTITLGVWSANSKARAFFAAQGFAPYQEDMWLRVRD